MQMSTANMNLAYACQCVYHLDPCNCNFYPKMYADFKRDLNKGFRFHLDMLLAKDNNVLVSCCGHCLNKIADRICILPNYPEDMNCVCNNFNKC